MSARRPLRPAQEGTTPAAGTIRTVRRRVLVGLAAVALLCAPLTLPLLQASDETDPLPSRTLSAAMTSSTGGEVTTTFLASTVESARSGWQGVSVGLPRTPTDRTGTSAVPGPMTLDGNSVTTPATTGTATVPYQRFDLP